MTLEASASAIRAFYFLRIPNVGDRINSDLITSLSGKQVRWTADTSRPHIMAAGSILGASTPTSRVWGTGVMHPHFGVGSAQPQNVTALRGALTAQTVREAGLPIKDDLPLGDPGYLAPRLLGIERRTPEYSLGVVAHYTDRHRPEFLRLLREPGVQDLNVHDDPEVFLNEMSRCGAIISSSLHGLVFAEALGIPNKWVAAGNDIAGEGFKFNDWFSTTARPEQVPRQLTTDDSVSSLIESATIHESKIDVSALIDAFPRNLDFEHAPDARTARADRKRPTPVFIISFNRADELRRCVDGVSAQSRSVEIVVHDNGSTDPKTLAYLNHLESNGTTVVRSTPISTPEELNRVAETVATYFERWAEPVRYIVTDCDIDMSVASTRALDVYDSLLNRFRAVECVGPMLRIADIPRAYPLFNRVMNRHIEQFWQHDPMIVRDRNGDVAVLECVIDTTFAMHRAGEPFRRLKTAMRVYEPYEALHLDWYRSACDDDYSRTSSPEVSHWNNAAERDRWAEEPLRWARFRIIRQTIDGHLEATEVSV